ncbi:MAG: sensor histidine kinase [Acidobacteria bacterium]|nr:sensor histidine kinase [Acidobacteriota bacterium]
MHPLLARPGTLGLYLLAWLPVAGLLVFLLAVSGAVRVHEAWIIVPAMCLVYAFVCLAAWYPCRRLPVRQAGLIRLAEAHLAAAAAAGGLWVLAGLGLAQALALLPAFAGLEQRLGAQLPLLFAVGVLIYLLSVAFHYVLLAAEASRQAEAHAAEARALARDAELNALKAQINPHFLFNSLNSISALTTIDAARAREMCVLLADFLRATLGLAERTSIPLAEELALVRRYLAVEKARFGARLQIEEKVDAESGQLLVPPLLLQPLVENAVNHGIAGLPEGGMIRLEAACSDGRLVIVLENALDPEAPARPSGGLGLANVRRRLEARYAGGASIQAGPAGERYRVRLSLPAETASGPYEPRP